MNLSSVHMYRMGGILWPLILLQTRSLSFLIKQKTKQIHVLTISFMRLKPAV